MAVKTRTKQTLALLLTCVFLIGNAHAREFLRFSTPTKENMGFSSHIYLETFAQDSLKTPIHQMVISKTDLNGDGLSEFILKSGSCDNNDLCTHYVLGETPEQIVELGQFEARKIVIKESIKNGSRILAVYQDPLNDYNYNEYQWTPHEARYVLFEATEQ